MEAVTGGVILRETTEADVFAFFEHQLDPEANRMAAFTGKDPTNRDAFLARWRRILTIANETITTRTIIQGGTVLGHVLSYDDDGHLEVSYWIGRPYWGRGVASRALQAFLGVVTVRPLYARVAKDNHGSLRVLQKCGFEIYGEGKGYAEARGEEVEEFLLRLGADPIGEP
ncbi:MAG TPA: GNAT family N-acetyltransferase [Symbiobacteriaceae bacterium]|nr:GNAT family N-acetyltransferase [Symbiobacteriaceae bacterium]